MRRKLIAAAAVAVLLVLAIGWRAHHHASSTGTAANATGIGGDRAGDRETARAHAQPASVSGRVTRSSDGAGIPGAIVSLARAALIPDLMPSEAPAIIVITNESGAWTAPLVAPGDYVIAAAAAGFEPKAHARLAIAPGEQRSGIDLVLDPGGTLVHGTVTDIGGGAIAGARITIRRDAGIELRATADFIALTGADGRYQISLADGPYQVVASHDDYARRSHGIAVAGKPLTVDFVLTPGGTIRGTVVERATGKPVPGALVEATAVRGRAGDTESGNDGATADDDGKFELRSLASGAISLSAIGRGFASSSPTVVELGIGEQVDSVRVMVDRAFTISGKVVDKSNRSKGIAGVNVGGFSIASQLQLAAPEPSAADGAFEIVGVRPASYTLYAITEGAVPEIGKPLEVVDHDVSDVTLELATGVSLSGRVDPPMAARIDLELADDVGIANLFEALKVSVVHADTDASGAFVLHSVPAGKLSIVATTNGGRAGRVSITVTDADQSGLIVPLTPRSSISGHVVDAKGVAVAQVHVTAKPSDHDSTSWMQTRGDPSTVTAADGSFRIVGLEAGKVALAVDDDQGRLAWAHDKDSHEVELTKGAELSGVVIAVDVRDGLIHGMVVGSDGNPVADTWVTARHGSPSDSDDSAWTASSNPVLTGADGRFAIDHLRRGAYEVIAEGPHGGSRANKTDVETGDSVTLTLAALGTLSGHVTRGSAPVALYDLTCNGPDSDEPIARRITAADGSYSLEHLAPGAYTCNASADRGAANGKIDVPTGAAILDLTLVPWASLTGVVVSVLTKQPIAGLYVIRTDDNAGLAAAMTGTAPVTDATGRFLVERVPVGSGTLLLETPTSGIDHPATHQYVVAAGQRLDLGTIEIVPPRTNEPGTLGLTTTADNDGLAVTGVKPGGPADVAGIKIGDRIAALDGQLVAALTPPIAQQLLSSGQISVGTTVQLALDRGVQVTLVAVKW